MKNALKPLAKSVLIPLGLKVASATFLSKRKCLNFARQHL